MADCCNNITLEDTIEQLKEYPGIMQVPVDNLISFVNGGATQTVNLGGVQTPTLRNLARQISESYIKIASKQRLGVVQIGSGLYVTESGLLSLDIETGTGLVFDKNGALAIDFGQMPLDRVEELLKSIDQLIKLKDTRTWYVLTGGNDKNDGSANTAAGAFKTVQACLDYVTSNYHFSSFNGTIQIGPGVFADFTVPPYTTSTGVLHIVGAGAGSTTIEATNTTPVKTSVNTGHVRVQNLTHKVNIRQSTSSNPAVFRSNAGTRLELSNVTGILIEHDGNTNGNDAILYANGGEIWIQSGCNFQTIADEGTQCCFGSARAGGDIYFVNSQETVFNGRCRSMWRPSTFSMIRRNGAYNQTFAGDVIGKAYEVDDFGIFSLSSKITVFPNLTAGTSTSLSSIG